jgi:hypothetical protein
MDEYFAAIPIGNATLLCVGGVTQKEAEQARLDGTGYYLFLASASDPRQPIQILAKFLSGFEAGRLAQQLAPQSV